MSGERRSIMEKQLLGRLRRLGILSRNVALDNVLDMSVEDILERRLQTLVFRKGLTKSIYQAREFITHGHIAINERRISSPGYLVLKDEESKLDYYSKSPISNPEHPIRRMIEMTDVEGLHDEQEK
jgi:small subunit ribosomal protein S4